MKLNYFITSICYAFLLVGCNDDSINTDQNCPDCIWSESSQKLVVSRQGGISGELASQTVYTRAQIPASVLPQLTTLKDAPMGSYYHHQCVADGFIDTLAVLDSNGDSTVYHDNKSGCKPPVGGVHYVDYYAMQNILQLLSGAVLKPAWHENSERFEVLYRRSGQDVFITLIDFTRDILPDGLSRRLVSLSSVQDTRVACPSEYTEILVRVTDNSGIVREYRDEVGTSCQTEQHEAEFIQSTDIVDMLVMVGKFDALFFAD